MTRELFKRYCDEIPSCSEREIQLSCQYLSLLKVWNEKMSLVSPASLEKAFFVHYVDCLYAVDFVVQKLQEMGSPLLFYDLGTGAGFPGIIFAIRFPNIQIILFEKSQKKQIFLMNVIQQLNLSNILLQGLVEEKKEKRAGCFFARAVMPPEKLQKFFIKITPPESKLVCFLGGNPSSSFLHPKLQIEHQKKYCLPEGNGARQVQILGFVPRGTI